MEQGLQKSYYKREMERSFRIKRIARTKKLTLVLPAQEAKAVAPITPILGQAGVNAGQFCLFFNKATSEGELLEEAGFPVNVEIAILGGNRFSLKVRDISVSSLYKLYEDWLGTNEKRGIRLLELYKIFMIKNEYGYVAASSFLSALKTFQRRKKYNLYLRLLKNCTFRQLILKRKQEQRQSMLNIFNHGRGRVKAG